MVKEGLGSTIDMNSMSGVDEIAAIVVSVLPYLRNRKQILPPGWSLVQHAMPFGATAAVYAFIRVALALRNIGPVCLKLCWCNFYDDFT